jgi:hypothetical protein
LHRPRDRCRRPAASLRNHVQLPASRSGRSKLLLLLLLPPPPPLRCRCAPLLCRV